MNAFDVIVIVIFAVRFYSVYKSNQLIRKAEEFIYIDWPSGFYKRWVLLKWLATKHTGTPLGQYLKRTIRIKRVDEWVTYIGIMLFFLLLYINRSPR